MLLPPLESSGVLVFVEIGIHFPDNFEGGVLAMVPGFVLVIAFQVELMVIILVLEVMDFVHIVMHPSLLLIYSFHLRVNRLWGQNGREVNV